jgi:hypothetical protein
MNYSYLLLIAAGLALLGWGLPASFRLKNPWHLLAAIAAFAGVAICFLGIVLVTVPDFFKS